MKNFYWLLFGICILALVLRIFSMQWNTVVHGDIQGDVFAAQSLLTEGHLFVSHDKDVTSVPHFFPPGIGRNLLVAHPPIWAMLGAGLLSVLPIEPTFYSAFFALKLLSVISGLAVVVLSVLISRKRFGDSAALFVGLWISLSYLMIDYSGNGSLYSLQAISYLVWIAVAFSGVKNKSVFLGIASGIGYLINHQSMVLAAASVIVLLCAKSSWKRKSVDLVLVTGVTFAVTSPWLIRNYIVYGDLFFSHAVNSTYVFVKAAVPREVIDGRVHFILGLAGRLEILRSVLMVWLPNNLYYIARKLFILAPILFLFFSFAWVDYLFSRKRVLLMLPILSLFVFHIFLSAGWPITKFRYFVPMFPLVLFIAVDQIENLSLRKHIRTGLYTAVTACIVILSYMTYLSVPTHTYYYDGAITNDPFHSKGEFNYLLQQGIISE